MTDELTETFRRLGARDPEAWAQAERAGDVPQRARFLALKDLWGEIDRWEDAVAAGRPAVARRLLDAGADPADVARLARLAAYEAGFATLWTLASSDGNPHLHELERRELDPWGPSEVEDLPGWRIVETCHGRPTGRIVAGLHEDLLGLDPSGREGSDLFERRPASG